ncbi:MAG: hypothetical protein ACOZAM_15010 [Pseudomonadota bacterium]
MTSWLIALVAAGVAIAAIWLAIRAATRSAREAGAAEERADATDLAREAEQEMTEIVLRPTSPEETKRKLDEGTF